MPTRIKEQESYIAAGQRFKDWATGIPPDNNDPVFADAFEQAKLDLKGLGHPDTIATKRQVLDSDPANLS